MGREAKITCPHCRKPVTVRIKDRRQPPAPDIAKMMERTDRMFDRMTAQFDRLFRRG